VGELACYSFYPTKNLGALGDGGAVTGRDPDLLARVRTLREYGWTPTARYISFSRGAEQPAGRAAGGDPARLSAAALDAENAQRRAAGGRVRPHPARRRGAAGGAARLPPRLSPLRGARAGTRPRAANLRPSGIGAGIHYPVPIHLQPGYRDVVAVPAPLTATERAAEEILSLPLHPGMTVDDVAQVAVALANTLQRL
jgi:dTDP-4-amino-4,6-dideoxygalactose transaminase